jgi:transcriptional regulator with XRE-family HTH domain
LTLQALSDRIDYSPQHISQVEHGRGTVTEAFLRVCDAELGADGELLRLLPDVILEHAQVRSARVAARRSADIYSDEEDDVNPTNRRGLADAGATAVLGLGITGVPLAAGEVDPMLPEHWECLLVIVGAHDAVHGPHQVLSSVRRELRLISEHRRVARGELRVALMRVEARWAVYGGWLCEDTGDLRGRTALLERALHLACEADQPDLIAWARARQAQWSAAPRAIRLAETGLCTPRASAHTRALCGVRAAHAHALVGDHEAAKRMLAQAYRLAAEDSAPPPLATTAPLAEHVVPCWEARCWAALRPATGDRRGAVRRRPTRLAPWPDTRRRLVARAAGQGLCGRWRNRSRPR